MILVKKNKEIYFDLILKYLLDDRPLKKILHLTQEMHENAHKKTDLLKAPTKIL